MRFFYYDSSITGLPMSDKLKSTTPSDCTRASEDQLKCTGKGKIFVVPDPCMHDGGIDAVDDSLEIYCVHKIARFCLSGETCPWRNTTSCDEEDDDRTCSRAGLTTKYMANAWCNLWNNHTNYNCCSDGFMGF